jgi:succinate-semialdehyde dehydrogenase/glutarate-semialdehyde dehydrogenase
MLQVGYRRAQGKIMAIQTRQATHDEQAAGGTLVITNPISGEPVAEVKRFGAADVIEAVEKARRAQPAWAARPYRERARVVRRFHDRLLDRRDDLMGVIRAESGKSRRDAFVEVFAVAAAARYYAYNGARHIRPRRAKPAIPLRNRTRIVYHPVGVVGITGAWNFPFILTIGDAIPALLAGNGVVIKPASIAPLAALWARETLVEVGLPADLLQIATGVGKEIGDTLVDQVDCLMFTGSTKVGRAVAQRAAQRLIPYSMELGGKNAMLVLADANLDHAAIGAVEGAFNNSGQVCINWERVYVDASIYDDFVERLTRRTNELRLGPDATFEVDLGALMSAEQVAITDTHVRDAVSKGAKLIAGGRRRPDLGPLFYEPTILADVTPEMRVCSEETFGPVLAVYRVESAEEAIRQANDSRYGLHHGVFTRDRRQGERIARQLEAGIVCVNDTYASWAAMDAPMGGFKESGVGRRHGPEGIRKYTEAQTIVVNQTPYQIGSYKTALSFSPFLERALTLLLRIWRYLPFIR